MITDILIRQAKPKDKPYKIGDGGGPCLLINAAGKYWQLNYRFTCKRKTLAIGVYPKMKPIRLSSSRACTVLLSKLYW